MIMHDTNCYTAFSLSSCILSHTNISSIFFFNDTATTEIYTLSLHDALPICIPVERLGRHRDVGVARLPAEERARDRKSTRLNSSHVAISYAVFCLKKKKYIFIDVICFAFDADKHV